MKDFVERCVRINSIKGFGTYVSIHSGGISYLQQDGSLKPTCKDGWFNTREDAKKALNEWIEGNLESIELRTTETDIPDKEPSED